MFEFSLIRRWPAAAALVVCLGSAAADAAETGTPPGPMPYPDGARPRAVRVDPADPLLRIDGRLDEAVWARAPVHDAFVQYLPVDRQPVPPGYRTSVQVVIEEHAIVFGIRAFDPHPGQLRAPLLRRDQVKRDQDFVAVVLDPVGTRRSAQFVRVNAAGVVADGMYIADTDLEDFAPDFEVEAAVQRDASGYSVELRVPLLMLRYPHEGNAPWRLMVARSVPREASMLLLSAPLNKDALNFIAELQEIDGLDGLAKQVRERALLSMRPELTLRSSRHVDGTGSRRERQASLGAEIKWRPRADLVFDATLNPDFSQVELDVPQLAGNTRFALSVLEKRPFFLESTDVLDLPLEAFYSRAITDPGWGLRATWRGPHADATGLSMRDDGGGLVLLPGTYATGVVPQDVRSRSTLLRGRAHVDPFTAGALLSLREYADGRHNRVAGADVVWRASEEEQYGFRALGSQTTALFDDDGRPRTGRREDGHHLFASWWKRVPGWNLTAKASEVSPRFRNDNGFVEQAGVRKVEAEVIRRWGEASLPGFQAYEFETYLWAEHRSSIADAARGIRGGETVQRGLRPGIWLVAAHNTEALLEARLEAQRARPGGRLHTMTALALEYGVNPAPWFTRLTIEAVAGDRLDVDADRVGRGATWLVDAKLRAPLPFGWGLESEQRFEQSFVKAPGGGRAFTDTAAQWLGVLHFSAQDSLRAIWQGSRFTRAEGAGLPAAAWRTSTTSIVFQRRLGLGRSYSIGASHQTGRPGVNRDTEVFAKASFEFTR